jgi:hypothetical protein
MRSARTLSAAVLLISGLLIAPAMAQDPCANPTKVGTENDDILVGT